MISVLAIIKSTLVAFILLDYTGTNNNNNLIFGSQTSAVYALGSPTNISSTNNEKNYHPISNSSQSSTSMSAAAQKTIKEICRKPPRHWVGDAFHVYPVFANKAFTSELSPFLMFDYAAPKEFPPEKNPNYRRGVGQHPHRGFETVTVAFQGEVEHADSEGHSGVIGPGDVQWMTAARGIIHEEFHSTEFSKRGGIFEMFQLWVNLPSSKKMSKPRYQPILAKDIPQVPLAIVGKSGEDDGGGSGSDVCTSTVEEGYAKIIAGNFRGTEGPAKTFTPVDMWVVSLLTKQKEFELEFVEGHTTLLFVQNGSVEIQGKTLDLADVAIMDREGTKLTIRATQKNTSLLVLSGEPIDEPIAARGPFVMNTHGELQQAFRDYQRGTHGFRHFSK